MLPLNVPEENFSLALLASGGSMCPLAGGCISPISVSVIRELCLLPSVLSFFSFSVPYKDTWSMDSGLSGNPG